MFFVCYDFLNVFPSDKQKSCLRLDLIDLLYILKTGFDMVNTNELHLDPQTRNMITGASNADCVILLIDVTKALDGVLLEQTKRHALVSSILNILVLE